MGTPPIHAVWLARPLVRRRKQDDCQDESLIPLSVEEAQKALEDGEPSIRTPYLVLSDGQLEVGTAMLKDHEVDVVVRRLGEVLALRTV